MYDALIVGAGFCGCTVAEQLASAGKKVLVIDKREHVAGNAYDSHDSHGVLTHRYGPHIFHTNSKRIFKYLSHYTEWRAYEHRVRAVVEGDLYPLPINRTTINELYGLDLDAEGVKAHLEQARELIDEVRSSEDLVLGTVGRDLFNKFYRGYTLKQWGLEASELMASVAARLPVRYSEDDRYFSDTFQYMPREGFTQLISNMLDHHNIDVELGEDFLSMRGKNLAKITIFTGPVDEYFRHCFGRLPYRSLVFKHEHFPKRGQYQVVATVNYPNDHAYTRVTEFKHLTGQSIAGTSIVYEYPVAKGDPYYPVPTEANQILYRQYKLLAEQEKNTYFVGRLAQYRYYNMDQAVGAALTLAGRLLHD
jgi:UDP-galactopyranose mutase